MNIFNYADLINIMSQLNGMTFVLCCVFLGGEMYYVLFYYVRSDVWTTVYPITSLLALARSYISKQH